MDSNHSVTSTGKILQPELGLGYSNLNMEDNASRPNFFYNCMDRPRLAYIIMTERDTGSCLSVQTTRLAQLAHKGVRDTPVNTS